MTTLLGWVPAPDGQVLMPGACLARDADGQGCAHGLVHLVPHQSTGLRAWLEAGAERALIRSYDAATADRVEAMEAPLFAEYEFVPLVRQDLARMETGGLNSFWAIWVSPLVAPSEKVTIHLRLVCFARPW
jgi:hypothetical protein